MALINAPSLEKSRRRRADPDHPDSRRLGLADRPARPAAAGSAAARRTRRHRCRSRPAPRRPAQATRHREDNQRGADNHEDYRPRTAGAESPGEARAGVAAIASRRSRASRVERTQSLRAGMRTSFARTGSALLCEKAKTSQAIPGHVKMRTAGRCTIRLSASRSERVKAGA